MKKLKALGIMLAAALAMAPVMNAFASGSSPAGEQEATGLLPTPVIGQAMAGEMGNNDTASFCTGMSDYDGRIKKATYQIDGAEWTVVMKVGKGIAEEELPEGMSEWETVYQETFAPTVAPETKMK